MEEVIHYPNLKTVLMVEKVLRQADKILTRENLKEKLPKQIMHQTLNIILDYLEKRGMIIDGHKGILWIYNPNPKLRVAIEKGREIYSIEEENQNMGIKEIKSKLSNIFKKYKIARAGIFGSYARGEQNENSDIDILVEIKDKKMSLLDFSGLKLELEDALGKKVDLVEYVNVKPLIKNRVLKEEVRII